MGGVCCALKAFMLRWEVFVTFVGSPNTAPCCHNLLFLRNMASIAPCYTHWSCAKHICCHAANDQRYLTLLPVCATGDARGWWRKTWLQNCIQEVWRKHIDLMPMKVLSFEEQQFDSWACGLQKNTFLLVQVVSKSGRSHALPRERCGGKRTSGHPSGCLVHKVIGHAAVTRESLRHRQHSRFQFCICRVRHRAAPRVGYSICNLQTFIPKCHTGCSMTLHWTGHPDR